jgi:hypothetical protein
MILVSVGNNLLRLFTGFANVKIYNTYPASATHELSRQVATRTIPNNAGNPLNIRRALFLYSLVLPVKKKSSVQLIVASPLII